MRNPATGETIANVAKGGADDTQRAIDAAARAFPAWRQLTAKERGARVKRWGELMLEHRDALAELLTREQGKPLAEARGEVAYAASFPAGAKRYRVRRHESDRCEARRSIAARTATLRILRAA